MIQPTFQALNASTAVQLTVDTVAPQLEFTPATTAVVGVPYFCQAGVSQGSAGGITYQLLQSPTGMAIDANSGMITWTPGADQQSTGPGDRPGLGCGRQHESTELLHKRIGEQRLAGSLSGQSFLGHQPMKIRRLRSTWRRSLTTAPGRRPLPMPTTMP